MSYEREIELDGEVKIEHTNMVSLLCKSGEDILTHLTVEQTHLLHMLIGLQGEVGELTDAFKKNIIYQQELDEDNVEEELGDIEFYLEGIRHSLGIARINTLRANLRKLNKRYEKGYSDQAAKERKDKEV